MGICYFNGEGCERDLQKAKDYLAQSAALGYKDAIEALSSAKSQIATEKKRKKDFQNFLADAENGDEIAQARLGDCYLYGIGTKQDIEKGLNLLTAKANNNNKEAIFSLACAYDDDSLPIYNKDKASQLNQKGAALGIKECLHNVAADYINNGEFNKGFPLLIEAAQKDNALSNYMVARYYWDGRNIKEDRDQVFKYLKRALELKCEDAYKLNDNLINRDNYFTYDQSLELAEAAAKRDTLDDRMLLTTVYLMKKENFTKALAELKNLTDKGDQSASVIYDILKNHLDNPEKAFINYADRGNGESAYTVACFYYKGIILQESKEQAAYWMTIAAKRGYAEAKAVLGDMYLNGTFMKRDEKRGLALLKEAAKENSTRALNALEDAYRSGNGVIKNQKKADHYARQAERLSKMN